MYSNPVLRMALVGLFAAIVSVSVMASELWVAGGDDQLRFYEIDDTTVREVERLVWSDLHVPDRFAAVRNLQGIVECKPVNGGSELLVTSWMGGVAKVDLATKSVNFAAKVPSAHSAALLPNGRIAVVGGHLRVFEPENGMTPAIERRLDDGHGIAWDEKSSTLYVLSQDYLETYQLQNWETPSPDLELLERITLPGERDGHDLSPLPDGTFLVSTRDGVWHFHPKDGSFLPHSELNSVYRAQSVVDSGARLIWVQAEESWWGRGFFVKSPGRQTRRIETPAMRLYKVRSTR